jgi:hypothetical protein
MARYFVLLSVAILLAAGCQSQSMVANLPPPNLNGPTIVANSAPQVVHAPPPWTPLKQATPRAMAGIDPAWIPHAQPRAWKWIVIHHSASPSGSAAVFDKEHREKGWDELGYHFVIGNGTDSGDGQVEVGSRWPKQKWGAHAKTPDNRYNDFGIGICLVGNFDIERPTPRQMQSLAKLTAYLMRTYHISESDVIGHRDTKPTDCPGRNMNVQIVRRMADQILVDSGYRPEAGVQTASSNELLTDVPSSH